MKKIPLTQGKFALVDDKDFDDLSRFKWFAQKTTNPISFRAVRKVKTPKGWRLQLMHRYLIGAKDGEFVDHINADPLDNLRKNLRFASIAENRWNSRKPHTNTSGYKGVTYRKQYRYWEASICAKGKYIHLGCFKSGQEASRAYQVAAKRFFGPFARFN